MKRAWSNPEFTLPKRQKQLEPLFRMVQILNNSAILDQILDLWILDRNEMYAAICDKETESNTHRHPYDWLGVQVMTAFYGPNAPWKINVAKESVKGWIKQAVPAKTFFRYTVLTRQQRDWFRRFFATSSKFNHLCNILQKYQLRQIAPQKCMASSGRGCANDRHTLVQFATNYRNLLLWRRILDDTQSRIIPLSTVLKEIETRGKQQSSYSGKFMAALCGNIVKLPFPAYELATHVYECIMMKKRSLLRRERHEHFRFRRALSILFEERGLDFNFWQSGNLVFEKIEYTY